MNELRNPHPGDILREEFLEPLAMPASRLARSIGVSPATVSDLLRGRRSVTAEMALRLGAFFRLSPQFWMGLQADYELMQASRAKGDEIARIQPLKEREAA